MPDPRKLSLLSLKHPKTGEKLDTGLIAIFPAPHSFTGEDCAELQVHGSPAGVKAILSALIDLDGIALAGAGDFTRRAFENGKLDLTAIEGLGDLLASETEHQRRQALARLEGNLSHRVLDWRDALLAARAEIEAHLDFSDEDDVPFTLPIHFSDGLKSLYSELDETLNGFERGRIIREGFRVVLAGAPNAGKSSLLNALAGSDLAIVTAEAGTTRDTRDVSINLGGNLVVITDTAGLRETNSLAEREGIRRTHSAMDHADLILWLRAPDVADIAIDRENQAAPIWTVGTKRDLGPSLSASDLTLSVQSGQGIADLLTQLQHHIEATFDPGEASLVSHLRDRDAIATALLAIQQALDHMNQPELCAEDLRIAADALSGHIGLMDSEMILDRLFAGFCIGK